MNTRQLLLELNFKAARSSGSGGQNVNKVASKVTLIFDLMNSLGLTAPEKHLLQQRLAKRLTNGQLLVLHCEESRSQHRNKELIKKRFLAIISANLVVKKKRKPTKPTRASIRKRLDTKKQQSAKKENRKKTKF